MRVICLLLCIITIPSFAQANFYRTYWFPTYGSKALNWCEHRTGKCGNTVAKRYCSKMGYAYVKKISKANDIGVSRFIDSQQLCKNSFCDGFSMIQCGNRFLKDSSYYTFYARKRTFYYPSVKDTRIDWCYRKGKACGRRVAYAFCRYQGYSFQAGYKQQKAVSQTRTIGSNELCIGPLCKGFESITCRRI